MSKVCLGCGSVMQSLDKEKPGYIIPLKIENAIYCERCFRLKHYHEMRFDLLTCSNEELFTKAKEMNLPVYYFVDLFNLNEESITFFKKIKSFKVLVLTKIDFIPFSISLVKLRERIKKVYEIEEDILFLSVKNSKLVLRVLDHMKKTNYQKFLFLGMTNVGKSSFLNVLSILLENDECPTLISEMPNTTLAFGCWNIGDFEIVDAPGFNYQKAYSNTLLLKSQVKKYLKPKTYQMKRETILKFEDLFIMKQDCEKNSITFYGSEEYSLLKTYQEKQKYKIKKHIKVSDKTDLVLPGIGFLAISKATVLTLLSNCDFAYEIRNSLFGGSYDSN